jgi:thiol-disulfide isomerase/thioredoxin
MDPQQRLLLEMSWEASENSGIKPSSLRGSQCGVFIGMATTDYASCLADDLSAIDSQTATGTASSIAANRISYTLDLRGPSMVIDTACSSSMVAFHQACNSIRSGECSQALVGGISLHIHPYGFIIFSKASMLSPQGRCNPFDASGDGYVRSEGGGIFFLKDYDQAIACARQQNKPLFIDFTGHGCTNCREMEANVWSDPQVLKRLGEDYVVVALYVDDKTELPESEWFTSSYDKKVKKTIGKQNADLQITNLNNNAQPFYVLVGKDERVLVSPFGYNLNAENFVRFLDEGKSKYKALYR